MTIRSKLILMLAIPLAALGIVSLFGFRSQSAQAEVNEAAQDVALGIVGLDDLALRVAEERLAVIAGEPDDVIAERITATNVAVTELANGNDEVARPAATEILQILGNSSRGTTADEAFADYALALDVVDRTIDKQTLAGFSADAVIAVNAVQSARDVADTQEEAWFNFFAIESVEPSDLAQLTNEFGHVGWIANVASNEVLSNGLRPFEDPASSSASISLSQFRALAEEDLFSNTPNEIDPSVVIALLQENRAEWNEASAATTDFIANDARQRGDDIDALRSLFTLLAVLGGLLLFTLIFVIGRSILGPLDRLIEHAAHMTQERLPFAVAKLRTLGASDELPEIRPIPKETNDEIGTLVDAFNEVQETAVKVATDQARSRRNVAEMFVSLGRRNQQLNHRMLSLISELEHDEQDPELLSGLYQLDHLATRMRRNAESLLVLAGNRSPRQWSRPVSMEDVVRSSLAEVELYERIDIGELPEAFMHGNVVTDVTHLLAELLDNATQFSEPSTTVSISAQETLEGVEIEVFDEGFGVGADDLAELNERISNPPALDEAPSRLLGLFVVGRLAEQHNIDVHLQSQPGVGTVATVSIPSAMFPEEIVDRDAGIDAPFGGAAAIEAPAIEAPAIEAPVIEIGDSGDLYADFAGLSALTSGGDADDDADGIPAWNPAAVHDEVLADAAVPTIDEMMEALAPTFPGVTIDAPLDESAPPLDDTWPLTRLDDIVEEPPAEPLIASVEPLPARNVDPVMDSSASPLQQAEIFGGFEDAASVPLGVADAPEIDVPFETAVSAEVDIPFDADVPFDTEVPVVAAPDVSEVEMVAAIVPPPIVEMPTPVESFEPTELFNVDQPIAIATFDEPTTSMEAPIVESVDVAPELDEVSPEPVLQAPPIPETAQIPPASVLPAPPIMHARDGDDLATIGEPEGLTAPDVPDEEPALSFGGLPTRSPLATLESTDVAPGLLPLATAELDEDEVGTPAPPSAFAAFASGVTRGLDDISNEPKPQFLSEGNNE